MTKTLQYLSWPPGGHYVEDPWWGHSHYKLKTSAVKMTSEWFTQVMTFQQSWHSTTEQSLGTVWVYWHKLMGFWTRICQGIVKQVRWRWTQLHSNWWTKYSLNDNLFAIAWQVCPCNLCPWTCLCVWGVELCQWLCACYSVHKTPVHLDLCQWMSFFRFVSYYLCQYILTVSIFCLKLSSGCGCL